MAAAGGPPRTRPLPLFHAGRRGVSHRECVPIVMTIHQPRVEAYLKIDNLILLADGKMAYYGAACKVRLFVAQVWRRARGLLGN